MSDRNDAIDWTGFRLVLDAVRRGVLSTRVAWVIWSASFMARVRAGAEVWASPRLANLIYAKYIKVNWTYAKMIGRPETHPIKKVIGFSEDMIAAVERWRAKQKPEPNLSEAIRRLVDLGLTVKTTSKRPSSKHAVRAKELARNAIDKMADTTAPPEERAQRRRHLTKGPAEFREARVDQPKVKGK